MSNSLSPSPLLCMNDQEPPNEYMENNPTSTTTSPTTPNATAMTSTTHTSSKKSDEVDATIPSNQNNHSNLSSSSSSNKIALDRMPSTLLYGKCKWFNVAKGWGFITPNDGSQEVFVHQSVIQMTGFRSLGEQEDVEYECEQTCRGLEATHVSGRQGNDCHGSTFRPRTKKRFRRIRCYNCGEFANHIASKCDLGPQPKSCHMCKKSSHLFADCPLKNESFRSTGGDFAPSDADTIPQASQQTSSQ